MQIDEQQQHGGDIYGEVDIILDFSVNTNPFGMPRTVIDALISRTEEFSKYPDPHCRILVSAIAAHEGVSTENILCGNGASDLIYRICNVLKPRRALVLAPTFTDYESALLLNNCEIVHHRLCEENDFLPDIGILGDIDESLDVIFLCNPNNPTGRLIPCELLASITEKCRKHGVFLIIDECFIDFTDAETSVKFLVKMPKMIILKAFTKTYSLAGLRLGYIISTNTGFLRNMRDCAQFWSVSAPAQIAGIEALSCTNWFEKTKRVIKSERAFVADELCKLIADFSGKVYPSDANFLLFKCEKPIFKPLLDRGILIRDASGFRSLSSFHHRIGIKTRKENIILINALKEILYG